MSLHVETETLPADEAERLAQSMMRPIPRISIQAFCETGDVADVIDRVGKDRRLSKVHLGVKTGGIADATEFYRTASTPNLLILETHDNPQDLMEKLSALAEVCDPSTKVVGIGHYNIDLHPSTGGDNYIDIHCCPFQIPLGSLLPVRMENVLPACKNIGVTHITNGCYRLHPVEWNIGEVVGELIAFCLQHKRRPREVREHCLADFQARLMRQGIELAWPNIGP